MALLKDVHLHVCMQKRVWLLWLLHKWAADRVNKFPTRGAMARIQDTVAVVRKMTVFWFVRQREKYLARPLNRSRRARSRAMSLPVTLLQCFPERAMSLVTPQPHGTNPNPPVTPHINGTDQPAPFGYTAPASSGDTTLVRGHGTASSGYTTTTTTRTTTTNNNNNANNNNKQQQQQQQGQKQQSQQGQQQQQRQQQQQ